MIINHEFLNFLSLYISDVSSCGSVDSSFLLLYHFLYFLNFLQQIVIILHILLVFCYPCEGLQGKQREAPHTPASCNHHFRPHESLKMAQEHLACPGHSGAKRASALST